MSFIKCSLLLAAAAVASVSAHRGPEPKYPPAADTSSYCSYWVDYEGDKSCSRVVEDNAIVLKDFARWNPTVGADCSGIKAGSSYCVEAFGEPEPVEVTTTTRAATTTTQPTATTTTFANGIATPQPTQSGMVTNCNKFHWIAEGVSCSQVISFQKITLADFVTWNPSVKSDCSGMWAGVNVCVGVVGSSTDTAKPTTTAPSNGVVTPQPTQPSMVTNCNKFHWIAQGVTCQQVISYQKISLADFVKWNPSVLSDCSGMWAEVQVCVGVIGGTPTTLATTTTTAGNGVSTPLPTQPGMVTNCAKFHWVAKGVTCNQIYNFQKITLEQFVSYNPTVKSDCSGMQAEVQVCVGLIAGTTPTTTRPPTTTAPGNGVSTPQPTQPGMVTNCAKFHWVAKGVTCNQIYSFQKITLEQFVSFNPTVKSDCTGMQAEVNVCVGLIGGNPTPTQTGNGIATPTPIQPGMVSNCKKFHWIAQGVTCQQVISFQKITLADFVKWNTGVGSDCRTMWAETNVCVGV
ncbi:hypothetical protein BN1723_013453 [Verticillium longisporum]|uniref:LysM domain-containing protein n=1 Tax=Verticillium longisporum TaxID=100787 RepID=A0A0G4LSU3_VERLO|nr:hypothetical protein BN1723_013453 [Verticillium longisporum]